MIVHKIKSKSLTRKVNGILLFNKPSGVTSNYILQKVKRLYGARKAGHTGSLDPIATGLLPICFGEATKFSGYLLNSTKQYRVTARLGIKTTTADRDGEVVQQMSVPNITTESLGEILKLFTGPIQQIPPMYSAVKYQGKPLYKLARSGLSISREPRCVRIDSLILEKLTQQTMTLTVRCSKGTYIRTLVEDIGDKIGCGAHVDLLHRTAVGQYSESAMINLQNLESLKSLESKIRVEQADYSLFDQWLLPVESAVEHLPITVLSEAETQALQQGRIVSTTKNLSPGLVRLRNSQDTFFGIGNVLEDGNLCAKRLLQTQYQ